MTDLSPIQRTTAEHLSKEANLPLDTFEPDLPMISGSLIDSFLMVGLATFLESEFNVSIPDDYVTVEHLDTLSSIEALISGLRTQS